MRHIAFALCLTLAGCHFNSSGWAPAIDLWKSTLSVTTGANALKLVGLGFDPEGTLSIDGTSEPFTFVSSEEIDVSLPTAVTAVSGTHQILFANSDGFVSAPARLFVGNADFHLASVSPTQLDAGREQTLTFNGTGFLPAMYVQWGDGTPLATTFVSSTILTAVVPAQLAVTGNGSVIIATSGNFCTTSCYSQRVPIRIGTFSMRLVNQGATDLVWDSARNLLHCADGFPYSTGTLFSVDLQTSTVVASYATAGGVQQLSLSPDGSSLYAVDRAGQAVRFGMPGLSPATVLGGPTLVSAVAAAPGSPLSVAVSAQGTVAIYDDQTPRAQQASVTALSLLWTGAPGTLYAMDDRGYLSSMPVTSNGVGPALHLGPSHSHDLLLPIRYDAGSNRFYDSLGSSIDLQGGDLRVSPVASENTSTLSTAVDGALGKLFVASWETTYHALTLRSFDLSTGALTSRVVLGNQLQSANRVVRFGTGGLAIATPSAVVLYEGPT